jgi:hypothetical protein
MAEIKLKLVDFLKSLKVNNKSQLINDICFYTYMPDAMLASYLLIFKDVNSLLVEFERRYDYKFTLTEIERLTRYYNYFTKVLLK